ncbi:MAG: 16S rRNA (guanine(527)-N(7))-methyltransferase RsmG [Acidobacteriota bacterium]|nr:16S rRNA (guanine(527)-N(7))-methyltransferase RsmG [Acidobacteriota bacterium]
MDFEQELSQVLPSDLPHRDAVVTKGARHLELIAAANAVMNLTRIVSPREAAIKHVLDSVLPWKMFLGARTVLDAGTGPGFPGIPLALVFPATRFTLADSTQKKARFVESVVRELELPNVTVSSQRVEDLVKSATFDIVTARAFAPIDRALQFLAPALKKGTRALLYKGPDIDQEIAEAGKLRFPVRVAARYQLPDDMGSRSIVEADAAT